jgi:hypothetical protein
MLCGERQRQGVDGGYHHDGGLFVSKGVEVEDVEEAVVGRPWRRLSVEERRAWADAIVAGVAVDRASAAISVTGPCPACGHDFDVVLTDNDISAELDSARRGIDVRIDWNGSIRFLVACHCDADHEGRPSLIGHGCGASGWLIDEPEA